MTRPEILSPCGGPESVEAALRTGADAVYLGAQKFSARHNAVNFSDEELVAAVRECHRHGVLVYLAFNTILRDSELEEAASLLRFACEIGVDGLIVQDMAVVEMVQKACTEMPLHASTQMTVHTPSGADAAKKLGFTRIVAAREMSLDQLRELCGRGVEVEAFAHGALCMCVSGQCYLSAMIGGRSANRGLCAGACRLPFSAKGRPGDDYALSLRDVSYCSHISEMAEAGVCSLKIEGRMKRPEYVAAATDALRRARDGDEIEQDLLRAVFSRSGFTDGYLTGKLGREMFGARLKEDVAAAEKALPELRKLYAKPEKRFKLDMKLTAREGEPLTLSASDGVENIIIGQSPPERALTRETTSDELLEQLQKLGGTLYEPGELRVDLSSGLSVPRAAVNDLRRQAVAKLDKRRVERLSKPKRFERSALTLAFPNMRIRKKPRLRVRVENIEQLSLIPAETEKILPLYLAQSYIHAGHDPRLATLALPRYDIDERRSAEALKNAKICGFEMVECSNIGQLELVKGLGLVPAGGFGLNVANSLAARRYVREGVARLTLSLELRAAQISAISCPDAELGAIVYGRLPLMVTRNCPISAQVGCKNCTGRLVDRTGAEFPVLCRREIGIYELLNSRPIWLADRLDDFNIDFCDLWFTVESPDECRRIFDAYVGGQSPKGLFTRGLYYRGVE